MYLEVMDETLRDGEQQVGVNFTSADKLFLAKEILELGIDKIGVMPIVSKYEEETSKELLNKFQDKVFASTLLSKKSVKHSMNLGFSTITLFSSLSDILLKTKGISKEVNLRSTQGITKFAKKQGLRVYFAGEDSTRADMDYLLRFIKSVENYIEGFIVCDTVGGLKPEKVTNFLEKIKQNVKCKIGVHFHNDGGFANNNSELAVKAGANILSGTVGGIGERAGNANLIEVLLNLKKEGLVSKNIKYDSLRNKEKLVLKIGGARPAKPLSKEAFYHESGIHTNALLKNTLSYNCIDPKEAGKEKAYFFGKFSGVSSYKHLFNDKYDNNKLEKIRDSIKEKAYKENRSFTSVEIIKMDQEGTLLRN